MYCVLRCCCRFHDFFSGWEFGVTSQNIIMWHDTHCSSLTLMELDGMLFVLIKHNVHIIGVFKRCQEGCGKIPHCGISLQLCVVDGFIPINEFMIHWLQWSCWELPVSQPMWVCSLFSYPHTHCRGLKGLERAHVRKVEIDGCPHRKPMLTLLHYLQICFVRKIFPTHKHICKVISIDRWVSLL